MIRALFVCGANKLRSPTAEQVFSQWPGVACDSGGLNNDADLPLSGEQIAWADVIFVMEKDHMIRLRRQFTREATGKRIVCLDIADNYTFMQPELVRLLELRAGHYLRA
jgi:predicted protein tyrosine phosphatase